MKTQGAAGDVAVWRMVGASLSKGISLTKHNHADKINSNLSTSRDMWCMWQGIRAIMNYKVPQCTTDADTDASLPDTLNSSYVQNTAPARTSTRPSKVQELYLSPAHVRQALSRVNPCKALGPYNIPGRVFGDQPAGPDRYLQNLPEPSSASSLPPSCLNDYSPIAFSPIIMKCFKRLVMSYIRTSLLTTVDSLPFQYHPDPSTEDVISPGSKPAWQEEHLKQNAVHRLKFSI